MKKLIPHRILPYMILMKQFEKTLRLNIWGSLFYAALVLSSTLIRWCTESPNFSWGGGKEGCPHNPPPPQFCHLYFSLVDSHISQYLQSKKDFREFSAFPVLINRRAYS